QPGCDRCDACRREDADRVGSVLHCDSIPAVLPRTASCRRDRVCSGSTIILIRMPYQSPMPKRYDQRMPTDPDVPPSPITPDATPRGDLRNLVLDALGREICTGVIGPDSIFTTESLESRFDVSRPVVREALHALEARRLVTSKRRVGVRVLPLGSWNVYDPHVIRWRLAGPGRVAQLRSLTELRNAIEPAAARLAATRAPLNQASDLVGLSGRLWAAGREGDTEGFLQLDREFHALVLAMSGDRKSTR